MDAEQLQESYRKSNKPEICAQCGWPKDEHRNGFCYHYSDEDTDYFYTDRKFIPKEEGKKYSRAFNGKIIETK